MFKPLVFCASVLFAFNVSAHAAPTGDLSSAPTTAGPALQLAQAPSGAPGAPGAAPSSGMPSADDVGKMKKRAQSGKKPSKAEMEKIKQYVPPEYHQYLKFR